MSIIIMLYTAQAPSRVPCLKNTYDALPWGGLVADVKYRNMPVDWSNYESITFEFAEPTKVPTQIMVSDKLKTVGKAGISSLTCYFDGQDLKSVNEVALQASNGVAP